MDASRAGLVAVRGWALFPCYYQVDVCVMTQPHTFLPLVAYHIQFQAVRQ